MITPFYIHRKWDAVVHNCINCFNLLQDELKLTLNSLTGKFFWEIYHCSCVVKICWQLPYMYYNSQGHYLNIKMFVTECSSKYSNKIWNKIYCQYFSKLIVSNFKSQRALNFQSCFILSSQSPLRVIRTCFLLLKDLSSEL